MSTFPRTPSAQPGPRGRRLAAIMALATFAVGALAACSSDDDAPIAPPASGTGRMTIGIAIDEPGLGFKNGSTYSGFDVDTATYIAAKLGVPAGNITWKEAKPAQRETFLEDGSVDLVVSTYSITDERKQKVDFAGPYFVAHQDLLVRRNDQTITGPQTLDRKILCSVTGTTSAAYVKKEYAGRITLREEPRYSDCVNALVAGDVDAVTTDDLILAGYASQEQYKGILRLVGKGFTDETYGVGVKKGDSELVSKVNAALKEYVSDGSWKRALDRNVGDSGYKLPGPPAVTG
jgi:glutamate transport system substrate-binding protein